MSEKKANDLLNEFRKVFSLLWSEKKFIGKYTLLTIVLSVVVSFIWPKTYLSTTTLLPQSDESDLASMMGLSGLASMAGISLGQNSLQPLYPDIITSQTILKDVIYAKYSTTKYPNPLNLVEYFDLNGDTEGERYDRTLEYVRKKLEVDYDRRTDLVTLTIVLREAKLGCDILNNIDSVLDDFIRNKRITNASEQRKWIERRLDVVQDSLTICENALTAFQQENRMLSPSPQLQLVQARLQRRVDMNNTLFIELKRQYELAKIQEVKDIQYVNILEPAIPANVKYRPLRWLIVLLITFFGFTGLCTYVYVSRLYKQDVVLYVRSLFTSPQV